MVPSAPVTAGPSAGGGADPATLSTRRESVTCLSTHKERTNPRTAHAA